MSKWFHSESLLTSLTLRISETMMIKPAKILPSKSSSHAKELLRFLDRRKKTLSPLLILTHDFPDPDAIASALALQHLAQAAFGIESKIAYGGIVGRMENRAMVRTLRIRLHRFHPILLKRHASVALVDTQPAFQNNPFPANRKAALILDQHPSDTSPSADLAIVDGLRRHLRARRAGAAANRRGDPRARRHRAGLRHPHRHAGYLPRQAGGRRTDVSEGTALLRHARAGADSESGALANFFTTLGTAIRDASMQRSLLVAHLGKVETSDLIAQVADFLLAYRQAVWCLVTGRFKGSLHASLRTTSPEVQAGEVLRDGFQNPRLAGGHGAIAGGSCRVGLQASDEVWQQKESELQNRVARRLRIPARIEWRRPFKI
jgi:nanoRNase/pAp phosphatase (c-di-AMP/oligoRNAs hydrolase)